MRSIVASDFPAPVVGNALIQKSPVLSTIDNPFVKTPVSLPPVTPSVPKPISSGMSLLGLNDLLIASSANTGINGYDLSKLKVDDTKIATVIATSQNLANSPVPAASQNGVAAPASIVSGQVQVQTNTAGNGIFSSVLGVLGNVLGNVLSNAAGGIASQGGSKIVPVGGGTVLSTPTNNPSPATQPGQGGAMSLQSLLLPVGIGLVLLKLLKII